MVACCVCRGFARVCGNIGDIEQARRPAELFLAASPNACLGVYPGVHVSRGQMQCLAPTSFIPVTLNSLRSVSGTLDLGVEVGRACAQGTVHRPKLAVTVRALRVCASASLSQLMSTDP